MTPDQKAACSSIIHTSAIAAGAGNALPLPGLGLAADVVALTTMTTRLATVFGGNLTSEAAKALAIAAIKDAVLKAPLKTIGKELSKFIPGLGQIVAPAATVALVEAAGWALAKDLERRFKT